MQDLEYTVIKFLFQKSIPLKVGKIAKELNIAHSTLGSCITRLKTKGFVEYEAYREVELTSMGRELAIELYR